MSSVTTGNTCSNSTDANFRVCVRIRPLNTKEDQQTSKKFTSVVKAQDNMVFVFDPNENSIRDILANNQSGSMGVNNSNNNNGTSSSHSNPSFIQSNNPTGNMHSNSNPSGVLNNGQQQSLTSGLPSKKPEREFIFDDVFDETRSTEEVFSHAVRPAVEHILSGYNSTVFAYGMTGAGKSFTIFGNLYSHANVEEGVAIQLLRALHEKGQESTVELTFKFSYLEIYNENIRDLMVATKAENLMVIEDPEKGVIVPDLTEYPLINPMDIKSYIIQGNTKRVMASTAANQFSSRSHAIIQITCEQRNHGEKLVVRSKLCIVDLAGSERAASTENRGMRLTEGANINRSLLALGNCINLLADSNKKGSFVPYRDSKLTRLLKESLGGNTKSIMIACVSPSSLCYDETVNTLKYAMRARNIKKSVKKNTKEMSEHASEYLNIIQSLRSEITCLKDQLQLKNNENLQLKYSQQQRSALLNYTSSTTSVADAQQYTSQYQNNDQIMTTITTPTNLTSLINPTNSVAVDEICEHLFENLEEYWEIKNTIDEIIKLNEVSTSHIAERTRILESAGVHITQIEQCKQEIEKRNEVIRSNSQILTEMDAKLIKNAEQKKELLQRICAAGQSQQISQQNFASQHHSSSVYNNAFEALETENNSNNQKEEKNGKDAYIAEMQQQMRLMQLQLDQKDVLLMQKQNIIRNLESTTSNTSMIPHSLQNQSAALLGKQSQQSQQPKKAATNSVPTSTGIQFSTQNQSSSNSNGENSSTAVSNSTTAPKPRKFFMKIPKEMINEQQQQQQTQLNQNTQQQQQQRSSMNKSTTGSSVTNNVNNSGFLRQSSPPQGASEVTSSSSGAVTKVPLPNVQQQKPRQRSSARSNEESNHHHSSQSAATLLTTQQIQLKKPSVRESIRQPRQSSVQPTNNTSNNPNNISATQKSRPKQSNFSQNKYTPNATTKQSNNQQQQLLPPGLTNSVANQMKKQQQQQQTQQQDVLSLKTMEINISDVVKQSQKQKQLQQQQQKQFHPEFLSIEMLSNQNNNNNNNNKHFESTSSQGAHFESTQSFVLPSSISGTATTSAPISSGPSTNNHDLSWSQPNFTTSDKLNNQQQQQQHSLLHQSRLQQAIDERYNQNKRNSSLYQKQQQQEKLSREIKNQTTDKPAGSSSQNYSTLERQQAAAAAASGSVVVATSAAAAVPPALPPRENDAASKTKANRSLSCYKLNGQSGDFELNSYAQTRKKVLEFKEKLSQAIDKPQNFNEAELLSLIKEYKAKEQSRLHANSGKPSEDDIKIQYLEQLLSQQNNQANLNRESENIQPLVAISANQIPGYSNLASVVAASVAATAVSAASQGLAQKKKSSLHNSVEQNSFIYNKSTQLSYMQQQLKRKEQQQNNSSSSSSNCSGSTTTNLSTLTSQSAQYLKGNNSSTVAAATTTTTTSSLLAPPGTYGSNTIVNQSNFLISQQAISTAAGIGGMTTFNLQNKILPRGMLSQMNSNYADTVNYSQNAIASINNSQITIQSSQLSSQRDRSPISTKNNYSSNNNNSNNNNNRDSLRSTPAQKEQSQMQHNFGSNTSQTGIESQPYHSLSHFSVGSTDA